MSSVNANKIVSDSNRTVSGDVSSDLNRDLPLSSSSQSTGIHGKTLLGSTKLNDMVEGATKGPGIKYAAAAAKIAECERTKHQGVPPSYIPESDEAGLVQGSRGTGPSINEILAKEAEEGGEMRR